MSLFFHSLDKKHENVKCQKSKLPQYAIKPRKNEILTFDIYILCKPLSEAFRPDNVK